MASNGVLAKVLEARAADLRTEWLKDLAKSASKSSQGRIGQEELAQQASQFLQLLGTAAKVKHASDLSDPVFKPLRDFLDGLSKQRVQQGFSSSETATFIFSLKRPLFEQLRAESGKDAQLL